MYKIGLAYSSDPTQRSSKRCERFRKDVSEQVKSKGCWAPAHITVISLAARSGDSWRLSTAFLSEIWQSHGPAHFLGQCAPSDWSLRGTKEQTPWFNSGHFWPSPG